MNDYGTPYHISTIALRKHAIFNVDLMDYPENGSYFIKMVGHRSLDNTMI